MNEFLLGILLPLLLIGTGMFFFIYLKGYPLRTPRKLLRSLFNKKEAEEISGRKALLTALAGTLGVGNITGVAAAVTVGGAGALFWMWVCALFSMIVKYAEIIPAMQQNKNGYAGAMYYIDNKFLAHLFAVICLSLGFSMGNLIQVRAAEDAVSEISAHLGKYVPLGFTIALLWVLRNGKKGVFDFANRIVPLMTLFYCILCTLFLIFYRHEIPNALCQIFRSAFDTRSFGGGLLGSGMIKALRYGAARGLISNEAGCGTAPIAHAASNNDPAEQGCLGIAEVFIDTLLLCTLTGLCVLVAPITQNTSGTEMVLSLFSTQFGSFSKILLALCLVLFAFATTVCWFYYCRQCLCFLVGSDRFEKTLSLLFSLLCLVTPFMREAKLFAASDLLVCLLVLINLPALWKKRKTIRKETLTQFQNTKKK